MLIKTTTDLTDNDVTPEEIYNSRRAFMSGALLATTGLSVAAAGLAMSPSAIASPLNVAASETTGPEWLKSAISQAKADSFIGKEKLTPFEHVTAYNNFYEFGYDKTDPAQKSSRYKPFPWQVEITGEVEKPGKLFLEDILKNQPLEERVYRLRCVEAWSMVIPWIGFPLADLIKKVNPTSKAKYVSFVTLKDSDQFPAQKSAFSTIDWPYREGLRIDEAMHPLTLLAVGLYGKVLPNQNGAPLRLVVPWKYGFKSIKSIVRIEFTEKQPKTTWSQLAPNEYGFYANVNPTVDHPRWSQAKERRLPSGLFSPNLIPTQMFNGYAEQVADLYKGLDLKKFY